MPPALAQRMVELMQEAAKQPTDILAELVLVNAEAHIKKYADSTSLDDLFLRDQAIDTWTLVSRLYPKKP